MTRFVEFTVYGKPLSMNHAYPTNRSGRRHLSATAKAYKENIGWEAKSAMRGQKYFTEAIIEIHFFFADQRTDTNNCIKLVIDAMQKIVYPNDGKNIIEEHYYRHIDKLNPRMEIKVSQRIS